MAAVTTLSNIISKLSIFFLIIAGNFILDIFSCSLRNFIKEYMIIKHIIGIFIMLFFVGLVLDELTLKQKIFQSLFLYIWFTLIMRSPLIITLIVLILIITVFIVNLYIKDLENNVEELKKKPIEDITGTNDEIIKINKEKLQKNKNDIKFYSNFNTILFKISLTLTIIGCFIYLYVLKSNLGKKFNIFRYLLGYRDQECYIKVIYKKFKNNPLFYDLNTINIKRNEKFL